MTEQATTATRWHLTGDWFDVCKCAIPCPCTFAQPPTYGDCEGVLVWHIREGSYGDFMTFKVSRVFPDLMARARPAR